MARVLKRTLKGFFIIFLLLIGIGTCFSPSRETPTPPVASQPSAHEPSTPTQSQPASSQSTSSQTPGQETQSPAAQSQQQPLPPPPGVPASETSSSTEGPEPSPEEATPPSQPTAIVGQLAVHFIDVGQGDSIFITFPDDKCMLIDSGPTSAADDVVSTIKGLGETSIDWALFTHPHEDHIGGAPAVFDAFNIKEVWMPRTSHTTRAYENLLLAIEEEGLMIDEAIAGKVILDKGNLKAWLLSPAKASSDLNNMSAVVALTYGDITFIFEGDAESEAEADIVLGSSVPDCDVLKVGHHGSSTSSTAAFLERISPEIAVISVGVGNSYGHPAQSTLDRLVAQGAKVYRTDQHGTVTIITDGTTLDVKTEKEPEPSFATPVVPATPSASSPTKSDITVYLTKTGEKYHRGNCRYLSKSKIPIILEDAKAQGYEPCSVCKPPN